MKDAFGIKLKIGDRVLHSVHNSRGTNYSVGNITEFLPKTQHYDKKIVVMKKDGSIIKVYPVNVVLISGLVADE